MICQIIKGGFSENRPTHPPYLLQMQDSLPQIVQIILLLVHRLFFSDDEFCQ